MSGSKLLGTLMVFLEEFLRKKMIWKKKTSRRQESMQNYPVGKVLTMYSLNNVYLWPVYLTLPDFVTNGQQRCRQAYAPTHDKKIR